MKEFEASRPIRQSDTLRSDLRLPDERPEPGTTRRGPRAVFASETAIHGEQLTERDFVDRPPARQPWRSS